jgi:hypothetical protein
MTTTDEHRIRVLRSGPTWRWFVGVASVIIMLLLSMVIKGVADQITDATATNRVQDVELALMRQRVVYDSALLASMNTRLNDINNKMNLVLTCIASTRCLPPESLRVP